MSAVADAQAVILATARTAPEREWKPSELRRGTGPVWMAALSDLVNSGALIFASGRTVRLPPTKTQTFEYAESRNLGSAQHRETGA